MQALKEIHSSFVPLPVENVDTDQIIPARFLKATTRDGFGKNLFRDWRYENDDEAKPKADFVLNQPNFSGSILVAGKNFGCGSSREHAAWSLLDYGFKAPYPVEDIFLNLDTKLPNLDINQLKIRLDSLYFDVNKNKLSAILISDGFGEQLTIDSKVKSKLDLSFISNALQIS